MKNEYANEVKSKLLKNVPNNKRREVEHQIDLASDSSYEKVFAVKLKSLKLTTLLSAFLGL